MKFKKRKKKSRIRGSQTAFGGFRQKRKGHGNSGGHGMSGSGKRGDHKKQVSLMMANEAGAKDYFGKTGFTSRKTEKKVNKVLNLEQVRENFSGAEINLKDYKILGKGEGFKAKIFAKEASKGAMEKMAVAGGRIELEARTKEQVGKKGGGVKEDEQGVGAGGEIKVEEKKIKPVVEKKVVVKGKKDVSNGK